MFHWTNDNRNTHYAGAALVAALILLYKLKQRLSKNELNDCLPSIFSFLCTQKQNK